eukprot:4581807-Pleurochrysis_carterae.AAC.1
MGEARETHRPRDKAWPIKSHDSVGGKHDATFCAVSEFWRKSKNPVERRSATFAPEVMYSNQLEMSRQQARAQKA